jgi:hypothetical protein
VPRVECPAFLREISWKQLEMIGAMGVRTKSEILVPMVDLVWGNVGGGVYGNSTVYEELKPYYYRDTASNTLLKIRQPSQYVQMRWVPVADQREIRYTTIH